MDEQPVDDAKASPAELMRQAILRSADLMERVVSIPEWESIGCSRVLLRSPSAWRRFEWIAWYRQSADELLSSPGRDLAARNVASFVMCAHHPDTKEPLFTPDDIGSLLEHHADIIERLVAESIDVMGITPEAVDLGKRFPDRLPGPDVRSPAVREAGGDDADGDDGADERG